MIPGGSTDAFVILKREGSTHNPELNYVREDTRLPDYMRITRANTRSTLDKLKVFKPKFNLNNMKMKNTEEQPKSKLRSKF